MKIEGSRNVAEVEHEGNRLVVKFHSGHSYELSPVTRGQYEALVNAPSVGSHYHKHFKGRFNERRLE